MMVLICENIPPRLRGRLTLWAVEVKCGVYVIQCTTKFREWLWDLIIENIEGGSVIMIWSTHHSEFGFDIRSFGDCSRSVDEIDGIKLMAVR